MYIRRAEEQEAARSLTLGFPLMYVWRLLQDATSLAFPPDLDNTSRKFIHEAVKRLGLDSKSRGKGSLLVSFVFVSLSVCCCSVFTYSPVSFFGKDRSR